MTDVAVAPATRFDEGKFTELLLYVASRMLGDPSNGSVKQNKVLFFSDVLHYAIYGVAITGADYVRHPRGPAPKGLVELQERLIATDQVDLAVLHNGARSQKILFPKRNADLSRFSGTEIATVEWVIGWLSDASAEEASDLSHALDGWRAAREREVIPYSTIFLYNEPVTEGDIADARQVAARLSSELESAGFATSPA